MILYGNKTNFYRSYWQIEGMKVLTARACSKDNETRVVNSADLSTLNLTRILQNIILTRRKQWHAACTMLFKQ